MSVTLMHIEYEPTNITRPTAAFRQIAEWLNDRFRNDEQLEPAERADPMSVNILANIVINDMPPTTMDREAVLKFQTLVQRNTRGDSKNITNREIAEAAREIADRMAELAEHHDPLHLTLL